MATHVADKAWRARSFIGRSLVQVLVVVLLASGCGSNSDSGSEGEAAPTVLVTTSIWADVVRNIACEGDVLIDTIVPIGGDPHGFEPSLADRGRMEEAVLVVANGLGLEEGLEDTLDAVADGGTPVFHVTDHIDSIPFSFSEHGEEHEDGEHDGEEHEDGEHDDEEHEDGEHDGEEHEDGEHDEHGHGGGADPHVWFDPVRVANMLPAMADRLVTHAGLDAEAIADCVADYQADLDDIDNEIATTLSAIPESDRILVTNHDGYGYFADRYGFEVAGTVIPTGSTLAATNPAQLEELAELIEQTGVSAIFAESQHSTDDAAALARRVGDIEIVTLFTGTLSDAASGADTYLGLLRTDASLIADALR